MHEWEGGDLKDTIQYLKNGCSVINCKVSKAKKLKYICKVIEG